VSRGAFKSRGLLFVGGFENGFLAFSMSETQRIHSRRDAEALRGNPSFFAFSRLCVREKQLFKLAKKLKIEQKRTKRMRKTRRTRRMRNN
jgi:hypothetical protein